MNAGRIDALTAAGLAEQLLDRFAAYGERTAISYEGETLSYTALGDRICACARDIGPRQAGARVIIVEPDPLASLIAVLAVWRTGGSAVLIRPQTPPSEIAQYAELTCPVGGIGAAVDAAAIVTDRTAEPPAAEECLVLITSGTSGHPKAAALSAGNIEINLRVNSDAFEINESDRIPINGTVAAISGLVSQALTGLWSGATIYLFQPSVIPATILRASRRHAMTVISGVASVHMISRQYWNETPFDHVRLVTQGGEPPNGNMLEWLRAAYPNARLVQRYGMTEAGPRVSYADAQDPRVLGGYVGAPVPHIKWHLNMEEAADSDGVGRLCIAGPNVFLGYVQPGGGYAGLDDKGYFQTEDIMHLDPIGDLYFRGRANRAFKCGAQFINPEQIESVLNRIDGVHDATCQAESHALLRQVPIAHVVAELGVHLSESDLIAACARVLVSYQVPRRIEIVTGFDLGPTGKKLVR